MISLSECLQLCGGDVGLGGGAAAHPGQSAGDVVWSRPGIADGCRGWGHWLSSNHTCLPVPCLALPQRSAIAVTSHRPWPPAGLRSRTTGGVGELSSTLTRSLSWDRMSSMVKVVVG